MDEVIEEHGCRDSGCPPESDKTGMVAKDLSSAELCTVDCWGELGVEEW